jgi:hypothetical protein
MSIHPFSICRGELGLARRGLALARGAAFLLGSVAGCGARQDAPRQPRPLDEALTTAGDSVYFGSVYPLTCWEMR